MPISEPITPRLKDGNWDLHQIAERNDGLGALLRGALDREAYVGILGQQRVCAAALDRAMDGALRARPAFAVVVEPDQRFAGYFDEDLGYFGRCPAHVAARPGSARFVAMVAAHADDPCYLLGLHYVRVGACNGNRFVARKARALYDLPATGEGTRWLDPFGEAQRPKWEAFKHALDTLALTDDDRERLFAGVRAAYEYAINMGNDERHVPAAELLAHHADQLDREVFTKSHAVVAHETAPVARGTRLNLTE